jgi:chromosome partitioning protein
MSGIAITIAQQKGGAGKTTLAAQLAVTWWKAGRRVAMVDVDPQGSLAAWYDERLRRGHPTENLYLVQVSGWRLSGEVERLKRDYDLLVIDSPPHAETDARVAVRAARLVVIPLQPSPMDLWAMKPTLDLAGKEGAQPLVVLNRVTRGKMVETVKRQVAEQGLPLATSVLGNRVAFAATMLEGRGVAEAGPTNPAAVELQALADEITGLLGI